MGLDRFVHDASHATLATAFAATVAPPEATQLVGEIVGFGDSLTGDIHPTARASAWRPAALLVVLLSLLALSGCLILPIPLSGDRVVSGVRVEVEQVDALLPGVTSRAEVLARIGPPTVHWRDARVFVYEWETLDAVVIWAFGACSGGAAGALDITGDHALIMQFDARGMLQRREVVEPWSDYGAFLESWVANGQPVAAVGAER